MISAGRENPVVATIAFLKHMNVRVTTTAAIEELHRHPDYPSIASISDALNHWRLPNICIKADCDRLSTLPVPFMTHLLRKGGLFAVVTHVHEDKITYVDPERTNDLITELITEFVKDWSGIVLIAEKYDHSGEENYALLRRRERLRQNRISLALFGCLALINCIVWFKPGPYFVSPVLLLVFLLLQYTGLFVSALLFWHEPGNTGSVLGQICSARRNYNCSAVLHSKAAKIWGVSWSELGFCYFAGGFLFALLAPVTASSVSVAAWLNVLAAPCVFFRCIINGEYLNNGALCV